MLSEAEVESQVIGRLAADGYTCIKLDCGWDANLQRVYGEPGMCDHVCLKRSLYLGHPHVIFLELKRPNGRPKPHQVAWMRGMQRRGFDCRWADCYDSGGKKPFLSIYQNGRFNEPVPDELF